MDILPQVPILLEEAFYASNSNVAPVIPSNQQGLFGPPGGPGAVNWTIHTFPPAPTPARPYVWRFVRIAEYTDLTMLTTATFVRASDWESEYLVNRELSIDSMSFDEAAGIYTDLSYVIGGALTRRRNLDDVLIELLVRGSYIIPREVATYRDTRTTLSLVVDSAEEHALVQDIDLLWTKRAKSINSISNYSEQDLVDLPKTFKLEGYFDEGVGGRRGGGSAENSGWRMSATKTNPAITEGRDIEIKNSFIYDEITLQYECDYRAKRIFSETAALKVNMRAELSSLLFLGRTANVGIHPLGIYNSRWMIKQREYVAGRFDISLVPYDPTWYVYSQQNLELISNVDLNVIRDFSHTRPSQPVDFRVAFETGAFVIAGNDERAASAVVPLTADAPSDNPENITHLVFTATRDGEPFPFLYVPIPVQPLQMNVNVRLYVLPGIVYDFDCFAYNEGNFFDERVDFREGFHAVISNVDTPDASIPRLFIEEAFFLSDSDVAPVIPDSEQSLFGPPGGPGAANWVIHQEPPDPTMARPYVWRLLRIAAYRDIVALTTMSFFAASAWEFPQLIEEFGVGKTPEILVVIEIAYFLSDSALAPVIPDDQQRLFGPPGGPGAANWSIHGGLPFSTLDRPYILRFVRLAEYNDLSMLTVGTFIRATNWIGALSITRHDTVREGFTITEYAYFLSDVDIPPVIPDDLQRLFGPPGGPGAANWFIHQPQPPDPTDLRPNVWRFARSALYTDITMLTVDTFIRATNWEDSQIVRQNDNFVLVEYAYFLSDSDVAPVIPDDQQRLFGPPGGPGAANWFIHRKPPDPTEDRPYVWRLERIASYKPETVNLTSETFIKATDWDGEQLIKRLGFLILIEYAYFLSDVDSAPVIPDDQQRLFGPPGGPGAANWFIHGAPPDPTEARPYVWRVERITTYAPGTEMLTVDTFVSATNWNGEQRTRSHQSVQVLRRSPITVARIVAAAPADDNAWAVAATFALRATNLGPAANPVNGDVVTLHTADNSYVNTRRFDGTTWVVPTTFVDGGTVIDGTVVNSKIASLSANKINAGMLTAGGDEHPTGILVQSGADLDMRGGGDDPSQIGFQDVDGIYKAALNLQDSGIVFTPTEADNNEILTLGFQTIPDDPTSADNLYWKGIQIQAHRDIRLRAGGIFRIDAAGLIINADTVTGLDEVIDDRVASLIQGGLGVAVDYDDFNNQLTLSADSYRRYTSHSTSATVVTAAHFTGIRGTFSTGPVMQVVRGLNRTWRYLVIAVPVAAPLPSYFTVENVAAGNYFQDHTTLLPGTVMLDDGTGLLRPYRVYVDDFGGAVINDSFRIVFY